MAALQIHTEDLQIAKALIDRDESTTRKYLYKECYPLFKSIYDNYYTDCECCKEFIDEIYVLILSPSTKTGKCQIENFRGESTLRCWLKTVCLFYCYNKNGLKKRMPILEGIPSYKEKEDEDNDSLINKFISVEIDFSGMNRSDAEVLLGLMPNTRYRNIIRLHYLEHKTHEVSAEALGMTMDNYYNKHKLAKDQYLTVCRKEEKHG